MRGCADLLLLACIVVYVVDLSGFTQTWLDVLSHYKGRQVRSLRPFSCSLCMVWWTCLAYAAVMGWLTVGTVAYIALLSLLAEPIGQAVMLARDALLALLSKLSDRL